eukprot:CAMPEP_0201996296 /NCGR_PEP_ID=MMETSP0905-20130828/3476_1 /ASSEMBLY_ACC=CAM_ASM_000554 /TAXON_ID=420261 /ORGANISM="Thalassiosira antarctica, Strain CCMP982" /LENGTH=60 /DNA_ID=CAMNT_0048551595 /DNA_START=444 /DNA_END=626 /DNA_ORIENTATION=-
MTTSTPANAMPTAKSQTTTMNNDDDDGKKRGWEEEPSIVFSRFFALLWKGGREIGGGKEP